MTAADTGLATPATVVQAAEASRPRSSPATLAPAGPRSASPGSQDPAHPAAGWPTRRKGALAIVAVAVVAAGVAGGWLVSSLQHGGPAPGSRQDGRGKVAATVSGSPSVTSSASPQVRASSPASTASSQASGIGSLLNSSQATRGKLQLAVSAIQDTCSALSSAQLASDVAAIQDVAAARSSEYAAALSLPVDLLPNGTEIKAALLSALQSSLQADRDYLRWARQEQAGCFPAANSGAFNAAYTADNQAVSAKTQFADLWNGIAQQYGQPVVNQADM